MTFAAKVTSKIDWVEVFEISEYASALSPMMRERLFP